MPATSLMANAIQPALVDVDEAALSLEELEEHQGTLLALDEIQHGVGPWCKSDNLSVAQVELLSHDIADLVLLN